ncbi:serine/threonine-protein kinase [Streptomyces sp. WMMC500]|uniref:serine/threonine-protein kinase n=1 Tax=Streptomyces sp. WMMC500 TaxID=3015154 RepID=UPI00248CD398|nr:serine/threonine-protein kinase [Streptomyces sp. WMMC500]WBB59015.1 serine/threonine-protein kinase [Streptomyces sp. WMMC500]
MARRIGSRYAAHQVIGRGSAGTVWLGEGPEGPVAIKLLREDLAEDRELVERFLRERTALMSLDHPRVVGVRDLVVDGRDLALVMDLVRGTDLRTRLERERRLLPQAAVAIAADVAEALAAAHAAGLVHRDVKPENVLLDSDAPAGPGGAPPALLTDFGVAKLIDAPSRAVQPPPAVPRGRGGTAAGTRVPTQRRVIGTPDYVAPEIVEGLPARAAVDIYALATVLYELLAGFTPFGGGHPGAVLRRHVTETVAPLPGIPDELWELLLQCLAKAPASRLRAVELAARLREILPDLEGLPPLDVEESPDGADGPGGRSPDTMLLGTDRAAAPAGALAAAGEPTVTGAGGQPLRGSVPLVRSAAPDSNRDTHTSMRMPSADELAGGARGTARVPRLAGQPRPGSARAARAGTRRRDGGAPTPLGRRGRLKLTVAAAVVAVAGVGGWLVASGGGDGGNGGGGGDRSTTSEP